jgi:hypothetical protein
MIHAVAFAIVILGAFALCALLFWSVREAQAESDRHYYEITLWRSAALDTAAEWVRREKGETAAKDFKAWALDRAGTPMLRDHLPAIAARHSARWPNEPGEAS